MAFPARIQLGQVGLLSLVGCKDDAAAINDPGARHHVQDRAGRDRFPGPALSDDAGGLAAMQIEADAVQDIAHALARIEANGEVLDL